jgi:hypothetical protein
MRDPFMLTRCGREIEELAEYITVDVTFRLLGGAETQLKYRIECGKRVRSEVVHPTDKVGELRERVKASLPPREQAHALQVYIDEALIDEADEMMDWIRSDVEVKLRATEARDFTWTNDPEPAPPKRERPRWPAMKRTEVETVMEKFKKREVGSDDEEKKVQP